MQTYWNKFHTNKQKSSLECVAHMEDKDAGDVIRLQTRSSHGTFSLFLSDSNIYSLWCTPESDPWVKTNIKPLENILSTVTFKSVHIEEVEYSEYQKVSKLLLRALSKSIDSKFSILKCYISIELASLQLQELRSTYSEVAEATLSEQDIIEVRTINKIINDSIIELKCIRKLNANHFEKVNEGHFCTKLAHHALSIDTNHLKRGRPIHLICTSKKQKCQSISTDSKAISMLNLAQIMTIEKPRSKWTLNNNVYALFTLTTGYDMWFAERGSKTLFKTLNSWLQEIKQVFEEQATEHKKRDTCLENMINEYKQWRDNGCSIDFFLLEKNGIDMKGNTLKWYLEHKEFLLMMGNKKLLRLQGEYTKHQQNVQSLEILQSSVPDNITASKNNVQLIIDHHIFELQFIKQQWIQRADLEANIKNNIEDIFTAYRNILTQFLQYGFMIETFISILTEMRAKRRHIYAHTMKLIQKFGNVTFDSGSNSQVSSLVKSMIPNISSQIWNAADARLHSMMPPHVYVCIQDFLQNDTNSRSPENVLAGLAK